MQNESKFEGSVLGFIGYSLLATLITYMYFWHCLPLGRCDVSKLDLS